MIIYVLLVQVKSRFGVTTSFNAAKQELGLQVATGKSATISRRLKMRLEQGTNKAMSFFKSSCSQLLLQQFLRAVVVSCLATYVTAVVFQSNPSQAVDIPTTATSIKKAPFSQVFFTGSVYAVKDKDYDPSEPYIGVSSLWSKNPATKQLLVTVKYCLAAQSLTQLNVHLTAINLLNKNQLLVSIDKSVKEDPARLRLVQSGYYKPSHGYGDPFDDRFLNPLDEEIDYNSGIRIPTVTCSSGTNSFDFTNLAGALAQLPNQTLQVKLVFSNGETYTWHLGKQTVQAVKDLLSINSPLLKS